MVTAPFSDSLCDVTMAKFIRTNKLPSSPTPTPTPPPPSFSPLHDTFSVFQLVCCCRGSMLTNAVLLLFC